MDGAAGEKEEDMIDPKTKKLDWLLTALREGRKEAIACDTCGHDDGFGHRDGHQAAHVRRWLAAKTPKRRICVDSCDEERCCGFNEALGQVRQAFGIADETKEDA